MSTQDVVTELSLRGFSLGEGQVKNPSPVFRELAKTQAVRLLAEGRDLQEVAKLLGRTAGTLANWWRKDEAFRNKVKELNELAFSEIDIGIKQRAQSIHQRLEQHAEEALDKVLELMNKAESEVVQMRCAQDILDRNASTTKIHRIDKRTLTANIDIPAEWLTAAKQVDEEEKSA